MGVTLRRSVRSVKKTATAARRGTPEIVGLRRHEPPIGPLWAARIELFLARIRPFSENRQCFQRTRALTRAAGRDLSFSTDRQQLLATVLTPWRVGRGVATGPQRQSGCATHKRGCTYPHCVLLFHKPLISGAELMARSLVGLARVEVQNMAKRKRKAAAKRKPATKRKAKKAVAKKAPAKRKRRKSAKKAVAKKAPAKRKRRKSAKKAVAKKAPAKRKRRKSAKK